MKFRDPLSLHHEFLLPSRVDEWIPRGHMARIIDETVDLLDLSTVESRYHAAGGGRSGVSAPTSVEVPRVRVHDPTI